VGHKVSQIASKHIIEELSSNALLKDLAAADGPSVTKAFKTACETAQDKLKASIGAAANSSGTTCVFVAMQADMLWTACVGDSRAVLGADKDGQLVTLDLSVDQCGTNQKEKARIAAAGGKMAVYGGSCRVISPNKTSVLAPTRSIGDCDFDAAGVIPTPEVTKYKLTGSEQILIVASDGLWEFINSRRAVSEAMKHANATDACDHLVRLAMDAWRKDAGGQYCDDITIIVCFLPMIAGHAGCHAIARTVHKPPALTRKDSAEDAVHGVDESSIDVCVEDDGDFKRTRRETMMSEEEEETEINPSNQLARRVSVLSNGDNGSLTDSSVVAAQERNADSIKGLNPNAKTAVEGWAWSPEWDRKMWPR